jgi:molecular chaperone DnaJ
MSMAVVDKTLYETLGISNTDASQEDIKKAYKSLAMKHHPDRNRGNEDKENCESKFKEINHAYSILSDPDKRKHYNMFGSSDMPSSMHQQQSSHGGGGGFFNMQDIFSEIFGGVGGGGGGLGGGVGGGGAFHNMFGFGGDVHGGGSGGGGEDGHMDLVVIELSLDEIKLGVCKKVNYEIRDLCDTCNGIGAKSNDDIIKCTTCNGSGIQMQQIAPFMIAQTTCGACAGKGEVIAAGKTCNGCLGNKLKVFKKSIDIRLPPGVPNGYMHVIKGKGTYDMTAKRRSDLTVKFVHHVKPMFNIDYDTQDVHITLRIGVDELFCGFKKPLEIYGKTVYLTKKGYFLPSSTSRIKGYGIPSIKSKVCGDLIVHYEVTFPNDEKERLNKYRPAFLTIFKKVPWDHDTTSSSSSSSSSSSPSPPSSKDETHEILSEET